MVRLNHRQQFRKVAGEERLSVDEEPESPNPHLGVFYRRRKEFYMILERELRNSLGREHFVYTAEDEGEKYEFDPLAQALKDCGEAELTESNDKTVSSKELQYAKTAWTRVEAGVRLTHVRNLAAEPDLTDEELRAIWNEVWTNR
jgi:hypothetical protein